MKGKQQNHVQGCGVGGCGKTVEICTPVKDICDNSFLYVNRGSRSLLPQCEVSLPFIVLIPDSMPSALQSKKTNAKL